MVVLDAESVTVHLHVLILLGVVELTVPVHDTVASVVLLIVVVVSPLSLAQEYVYPGVPPVGVTVTVLVVTEPAVVREPLADVGETVAARADAPPSIRVSCRAPDT